MRYGSVCSGIEAATAAWHPLGWKPSFFSEIEAFPRAVLEHHYPDVPLHGDFTTIQDGNYESIELLVGGTPCQSFSVAGLRKGLDDPRGNLMLGFGALAKRLRPTWLVWENVPGVLSANGGRDFGTFLGMLGELGYGFAYRVLDASGFGVCQRRRRVFVIGFYGDWHPAAAVLFDRESLAWTPEKVPAVKSEGALFFRSGNRAIDREWPETLSARDYKESQIVCTKNYVRKLTPKEYERLQGFPDDYTKIPYCGKQSRYKALGNSMAVPVMAWIGGRIQQVEQILSEQKEAAA